MADVVLHSEVEHVFHSFWEHVWRTLFMRSLECVCIHMFQVVTTGTSSATTGTLIFFSVAVAVAVVRTALINIFMIRLQ